MNTINEKAPKRSLIKITGLLLIALTIMLLLNQYYNIRDIAIRLYTTFIPVEKGLSPAAAKLIKKYQHQNLNTKYCDYLLIGDSHTFALKDSFIKENVLNRSINGETTSRLLRRFDENIQNIHYKIPIIQIGYNDFKYRSVEQAIENYKIVLKRLDSNTIYVISLFPVCHKRSIINKKIATFNTMLERYCKLNTGLRFVNIHSKLYNPNTKGIISTLTVDGVHLNPTGNSLYARELKKIMQ